MWSGLGASLRLGVSGSPAIELFGESPGRLVLSCRSRHAAAIELLARQFGLAVETLGTVGGDRLRIELTGQGATGAAEERGSRVADALDVSLADLRHTWDHGLAAPWAWSRGRAASRSESPRPFRRPARPPSPRTRATRVCGIFGAVTPGVDAAGIAALGVFSLQHRGQESAGIAVSDGSS